MKLLLALVLLLSSTFGYAVENPCVSKTTALASIVFKEFRRPLGSFAPHLDTATPERPDIWIVSEGQTGLDPEKAKAIPDFKERMKNNTYDYNDPKKPISGTVQDHSGVYFVSEGHTRLAAAIEIARETGDWGPFKKLIQNGKWDKVAEAPPHYRTLPSQKSLSRWNLYPWDSLLTPFFPPRSALRRP